jgi:uncharacterized protein DUF3618
MTTKKQQADRMRMPGEEPTDEDLLTDAELTRQELGETVAALGAKMDVKTRVQAAAKEKAEAVRAGGTELVHKLPDPVAQKVAPAWERMSRRPAVPLGGLAALVAGLLIWLRIHKRNS